MIEVDIHNNYPVVKDALSHLEDELTYYKLKTKVLKIIVGYGSKGGTHKIKNASIEYLKKAKDKHEIKDFILCEKLGLGSQTFQQLKPEYQKLIPSSERKEANEGAIIIFL